MIITNTADDSLKCFFFIFILFYLLFFQRYIEDIYSFDVNTINIVIECNENISIFMSAKHEYKFECFHHTKFLWYPLKKSKFSFYFIVYTPMRVSDVIL